MRAFRTHPVIRLKLYAHHSIICIADAWGGFKLRCIAPSCRNALPEEPEVPQATIQIQIQSWRPEGAREAESLQIVGAAVAMTEQRGLSFRRVKIIQRGWEPLVLRRRRVSPLSCEPGRRRALRRERPPPWRERRQGWNRRMFSSARFPDDVLIGKLTFGSFAAHSEPGRLHAGF